MSQNNIKQKYTPSDTIDEGWTYVMLPELDVILATKITVTKVMKNLNPDDSILKDPEGLPILSFQSANVMKVLTKQQYDVECQRRLKK